LIRVNPRNPWSIFQISLAKILESHLILCLDA
jgi:hypothetical protein